MLFPEDHLTHNMFDTRSDLNRLHERVRVIARDIADVYGVSGPNPSDMRRYAADYEIPTLVELLNTETGITRMNLAEAIQARIERLTRTVLEEMTTDEIRTHYEALPEDTDAITHVYLRDIAEEHGITP